jgi:hypothetical protein
LLFSQNRPILAPLSSTPGLFVDESSEGELGLRGAFIFAVLVALAQVLKARKNAACQRAIGRLLTNMKAFGELGVPHHRSIQAQILKPQSKTPNKSYFLKPSLCPSISDLFTFTPERAR